MEPDRRELLCGVCAFAVACTGPGSPMATPADGSPVDTDTSPVPSDPGFDPCVEPGTAAEGWVEIPFADEPQLRDLYGFAYLRIDNVSIVIAQVEQDCFVALERPCSHEGEPIEYRPSRNGFVCPRHGALYAWDGEVIGGPAPLPLPSLPCGVRGDSLWIRV